MLTTKRDGDLIMEVLSCHALQKSLLYGMELKFATNQELEIVGIHQVRILMIQLLTSQ